MANGLTDMRLRDKVAIVTGGGSGFGRGIAELFAAEGAKVVVADINGAAARVCAEAIGPGLAIATTTDVTKRADVDAMVAAAVDAFGGLDCLVNNAGVTHMNQSLMTVTEDEFDRIYSVNVKSIYLTTLAVVPVLEKRGGGSIINTASTAGGGPRPGGTGGNGEKGAARNQTTLLGWSEGHRCVGARRRLIPDFLSSFCTSGSRSIWLKV